ncbi:hypothetical protein H6B51_16695 [Pseudoflavonifractor phocaeensis]|nr:hypothetical protein [Pseudoflavonifractor phocaeensis]
MKLNKRKQFGSSSEQLDQIVMEQFAHLFNEAEAWDADSVEPTKKGEQKKPRKRRSGSIDDVIPKGTPVEVVDYLLRRRDRRSQCDAHSYGAHCDPRQFCVSLRHCASRRTEVRDVLPAVPVGAGV